MLDEWHRCRHFTNWFPTGKERNAFQFSVIWHEYRTNYHRADYLVATVDGKMAAVAQLNSPSYKKPSDLKYLLHGWLSVYKSGNRKVIDEREIQYNGKTMGSWSLRKRLR